MSAPLPPSSLPEPLRLLIVGGGAVVSDLYLPALARMGWTDHMKVTDLSLSALEGARTRHPWISTRHAGYEEVLADPTARQRFDAVVIALPNSLHVPAVTAALNAGFPVLCEKPLAMSRRDCESLGALAESRKLPLMTGMVRRLSQAARTVREALEGGLIGILQAVRVEHGGPYAWTSASGAFFKRENGGILADLGVHHLDWLGSLLGPLAPMSYGDDACGGVEASCRYVLQTAAGVEVRLHLSHLHSLPNTTTFIGDKGSLVVGKDDFASCQWHDGGGLLRGELCCGKAFADAAWPPDFLSCFSQQFVNFSRLVRGQGTDYVPASEAALTMGLIEHAYSVRDASQKIPGDDRRSGLPLGRTVVTGGTGFIGTALVERLAHLGFSDIVVPVRGYQTCASVARFQFQLPRVNLSYREAVRAMVKDCRWVFHLALGDAAEDARRITVDATKILVEEAAAAGVEAVIVLSTTWVYGTHGPEPFVDETSPLNPAGDSYGRTKAVMQQWCLEKARTLNRTRLVVINPSCVYGPGGKTYTKLPAELARAGQFAWVNGGGGTANYIYIDNLIDAMLLTSIKPEAHGRSFIASDGWSTWREFLSPLLPAAPGGYASFKEEELAALEKQGATRLRHVWSSLKQLPVLRSWVKERRMVQMLRPHLPKHWTASRVPGSVARLATTPPVPWIRNIFGTGTTRYRSDRLKQLGWIPRVSLTEGLARARAWVEQTLGN
ncbi:MAG: hypothetical protein JWO94_2875 [Verrucomicrobiaceae bacterium]|nr:hypothetical protein [Verrucomicrobiaceae bacterium]